MEGPLEEADFIFDEIRDDVLLEPIDEGLLTLDEIEDEING